MDKLPEETTTFLEDLAQEQQKRRTFTHRKQEYQSVMERAEERRAYYKGQRFGRVEQVQEADYYMKQYEAIRNQAEIKLLKLVLEQ